MQAIAPFTQGFSPFAKSRFAHRSRAGRSDPARRNRTPGLPHEEPTMTARVSISRILFATLLAAPVVAFAAPVHPDGAALSGRVSLEITGLDDAGGEIAAALYSQDRRWLGPDPVAARRKPAEGSGMRMAFEDLAPGRYAAVVYQDVNVNGELDTGFMGLPTEPFGFTAGARVRFGPPSFDAAAFDVTAGEETVQSVTLRRGR